MSLQPTFMCLRFSPAFELALLANSQLILSKSAAPHEGKIYASSLLHIAHVHVVPMRRASTRLVPPCS